MRSYTPSPFLSLLGGFYPYAKTQDPMTRAWRTNGSVVCSPGRFAPESIAPRGKLRLDRPSMPRRIVLLFGMLALAGCDALSAKVDNPVFGPPPPRVANAEKDAERIAWI